MHKSFTSGAETLNVLEGVNLTVGIGEQISIIGQSGSGKSTFLQIAGLLDSPTSGNIYVEGLDASKMSDREKSNVRLEKFGFVYQSHHLLGDFTALENVLIPAKIKGRVSPEDKEYSLSLLEKVGLLSRQDHFPSQMSGGERQRVAIARALMNKPMLLLADEPTGNLDPQTAADVSKLLKNLVDAEGLSILMVTHNHEMAKGMDKVFTMDKGVLSHE